MADWYYAQNDEQLGPVTAAALKEMAVGGKLGRDDLIWREGMQRWAPAHKVRGLFSESEEGEKKSKLAAANGNADVEVAPKKERGTPVSDVVPVDELDEDESGSLSGDEETAIDVLPLGGPEESKLHVPVLTAPDQSPESQRQDPKGDSNEIVVFEPASTTPPPPMRKATASESDAPPISDSASGSQTRIDVPARKRAWAMGIGLFLQTFTWVTCLLVILIGGVVYLGSLMMTSDASQRLAASAIYATFVVASYFLARCTERISRAYGQWFGVTRERTTRRGVRDRNWQRFQ